MYEWRRDTFAAIEAESSGQVCQRLRSLPSSLLQFWEPASGIWFQVWFQPLSVPEQELYSPQCLSNELLSSSVVSVVQAVLTSVWVFFLKKKKKEEIESVVCSQP